MSPRDRVCSMEVVVRLRVSLVALRELEVAAASHCAEDTQSYVGERQSLRIRRAGERLCQQAASGLRGAPATGA